jgi:ATP-dependent RNA/DNA helicase IGHMBP2
MSENRLKTLIAAVEEERKHEEDFFQQYLLSKSTREKVKLGFAWSATKLISKNYAIGENIELTLERNKAESIPHKLKEGVGVRLSALHKGEEISYSGTISFLKRNTIRILLNQEIANLSNIPDWASYTIEIIYDERPYTIMKATLQTVMELQSGPLKILRDGINNKDLLAESSSHALLYPHDHLNESQKKAIHTCLNAAQMGIIHGPPGTGKTTTITALVKELVKIEKRVLVCAPSNNATDLLASLLDAQGIRVLRIGNITRIGDEIAHLTIDEKTRNHTEWSRIKKIKIEAEEAKKLATTHKRKYGQEQRDERKDLLHESRELYKWARELERKITSDLISEAQVILCTLIGTQNEMLKDLKFNTVIIDEASQTLEPEAWTAILKANRVILAGDHMQLPPTVKSQGALKLGLNHTLLDRMTDVIAHSTLLTVQYRMNDDILHFPNINFYKGKLVSSLSVKSRFLKNDAKPIVFIDTAGAGFEEEFNHEYKSICNKGEFFILREHLMQHGENIIGHSIGIITPYAEQVRYVQSQIQEDSALWDFGLEVDSIDGFQGQEKDIIYLSLVRSNGQGEIGFLADERRLNVALTRAKLKLIVIGDSSTLGSHEIFIKYLNDMENRDCYQSAYEYIS